MLMLYLCSVKEGGIFLSNRAVKFPNWEENSPQYGRKEPILRVIGKSITNSKKD